MSTADPEGPKDNEEYDEQPGTPIVRELYVATRPVAYALATLAAYGAGDLLCHLILFRIRDLF